MAQSSRAARSLAVTVTPPAGPCATVVAQDALYGTSCTWHHRCIESVCCMARTAAAWLGMRRFSCSQSTRRSPQLRYRSSRTAASRHVQQATQRCAAGGVQHTMRMRRGALILPHISHAYCISRIGRNLGRLWDTCRTAGRCDNSATLCGLYIADATVRPSVRQQAFVVTKSAQCYALHTPEPEIGLVRPRAS